MKTAVYTPKQVAEKLGVCRQTVYNMIWAGLLPAVKVSHRCVRITDEDLNEFLQRNKRNA